MCEASPQEGAFWPISIPCCRAGPSAAGGMAHSGVRVPAGILAIAALNIALLWCIAGAVIWQGYRDAVADGKRTAANFSLATAAYTQQALLATDLMLRSILDWVADEDIQSEAQFAETMTSASVPRRHARSNRWLAAGQRRLGLQQGGLSSQLVARMAATTDLHRGSVKLFQAEIDPEQPDRVSSSAAMIGLNTKRWNFYFSRRNQFQSGSNCWAWLSPASNSNYFANLFRSDLARRGQLGITVQARWRPAGHHVRQASELMGKTYDNAAAGPLDP